VLFGIDWQEAVNDEMKWTFCSESYDDHYQ
jgi:hypothetical protein